MTDRVTFISGHIIFTGRPYFTFGDRNITPAQLVFHHFHPESYIPGTPVFSHCGQRQCVEPTHLHVSVLASRFMVDKNLK